MSQQREGHLLLGYHEIGTADYTCVGALDIEYAAHVRAWDLHLLLLALDDLQLRAPVFVLGRSAIRNSEY